VFSLSSHSGNGLSGYALDYIIFGNGFMEQRQSRTGQLLRLETSPAKYTRRGLEDGVFWFVENYVEPHDFAADSVFHLQEPDINQELYGLPEYLSALNSVWLNESATLYRRKYFENGAHAGYVMYVTDPAQNKEDISALRDMMSKSKGDGNFRNIFYHAPNGKPDAIKIIPLSEVATKDDFFNIKNATRDDLLSAHHTRRKRQLASTSREESRTSPQRAQAQE